MGGGSRECTVDSDDGRDLEILQSVAVEVALVLLVSYFPSVPMADICRTDATVMSESIPLRAGLGVEGENVVVDDPRSLVHQLVLERVTTEARVLESV